jgi:Tfp pilus assembly protein PilF
VGDYYLLVRIRAASALSSLPKSLLKDRNLETIRIATDEYIASLSARPDHWASHYNLGNLFLNQGKLPSALAAFETACRFDPQEVTPLVNISIVQARMGELGKADESLTRALKIAPKNAAANFNMGLVKAELNDLNSAEKHLRVALEADPTLGEAAFNLSIILAKDRPTEALHWSRKAADLRPGEPKYAYTLAFYEHQQGNSGEAIKVLQELTRKHPKYLSAYMLMAEIHEKQGQKEEAEKAYRAVLSNKALTPQEKGFIESRLNKL